MDIIYYHPFFNAQIWLDGMRKRLPEANIRQWQSGDDKPADYALVWQPPFEMLAKRQAIPVSSKRTSGTPFGNVPGFALS